MVVGGLFAPVIQQLFQLVHDLASFFEENLQYFRVNGVYRSSFGSLINLLVGFGRRCAASAEGIDEVQIPFRLLALFKGVQHGFEAANGSLAEGEGRRPAVVTSNQFVQSVRPGFRQVCNGVHIRQASATLESVQLLLERCDEAQIFRLFSPLVQALGDRFVDLQAFVQEDADEVIVSRLVQGVCKAAVVFNRDLRILFQLACIDARFFLVRLGLYVSRPEVVARAKIGQAFPAQNGLYLLLQFFGRRAGLLGSNLFDHLGQSVVAGEEQINHFAAGFKLAFSDFFEQVFQYVSQIADGLNTCHAGTTLEGVHIPLQLGGNATIGRIFAPGVQGTACGVDQVVGFFQEDADQFRVQVRKVGDTFSGGIFDLRGIGFVVCTGLVEFDIGQRQFFGLGVRCFNRCDIGDRPNAAGIIDVVVDFLVQVRRWPWLFLRFERIDHAGQAVVATEQQIGKLVVDRELLLRQAFEQVFEFV